MTVVASAVALTRTRLLFSFQRANTAGRLPDSPATAGSRLPKGTRLASEPLDADTSRLRRCAPQSAQGPRLLRNVYGISRSLPQQLQNDPGEGLSQYSDVDLMSVRQRLDSNSTAKCCRFAVTFLGFWLLALG